jgi:hypothetical protein
VAETVGSSSHFIIAPADASIGVPSALRSDVNEAMMETSERIFPNNMG